jgi:hypothetical protein
MSFAMLRHDCYCFSYYPDYAVTIHRMHGEHDFYIIRVTAVIYYKEIVVSTQRRLTGTPYSSFTYQRNPSDPIINPSPISMSCIFFTELKPFVALS